MIGALSANPIDSELSAREPGLKSTRFELQRLLEDTGLRPDDPASAEILDLAEEMADEWADRARGWGSALDSSAAALLGLRSLTSSVQAWARSEGAEGSPCRFVTLCLALADQLEGSEHMAHAPQQPRRWGEGSPSAAQPNSAAANRLGPIRRLIGSPGDPGLHT